MKSDFETLEAEVLDGIQPFSGLPVRAENVTDQVILAGGTMMQTRTNYTTAVTVQQPRSIAKITNNVLEEARLAGKSFYYRWPTKNKDGSKGLVQGASIDLAMSLFRYFGNCAYDLGYSETATHSIFTATFIDLESGTSSPRMFKQRKNQNTGMKDKDRADDIVMQIGQSKAIRNAIIKYMPEWLVERAIEVATEAELNKAKKENIHLSRQKVLEFFGQYGVTVDRIEAERKRPVDQWTPDDIVDLRGMATALKEGRASGEELFPMPETEKPAPKPAPVEAVAPANNPAPSVPEPLAEVPESPPVPEAPRTRAPRKKPEQAAMDVQPVRENGPAELTDDEKKIMARMVAAKEYIGEDIFNQAVSERGLKPMQTITPTDAKWILARMNQIIDETA